MSLLGELIPRLTPQAENAATDALEYVLTKSTHARQAVAALLSRYGVPSEGDLRFAREATGDAGERPDISVSDDSGAEVALIEVKFWAGFTNNQPLGYVRRLAGNRPSALVFIVPDSRVISTWRHVESAIESAGERLRMPGEASLSVRSGSLGSISLVALSWRLFLSEIEVALSAAHDTEALSDLRQLKGLVDRMNEDEFVPLHADELSSGVARRHMQLTDLLHTLYGALAEGGVCDRPSALRASNAWGIGFGGSVYLHGIGFWLGVYYGPRRDLQETPLWMQLHSDASMDPKIVSALAPLRLASPPRMIDHHGNWMLPLTVPTQLERDEIIRSLVTQVRSIADTLIGHRG